MVVTLENAFITFFPTTYESRVMGWIGFGFNRDLYDIHKKTEKEMHKFATEKIGFKIKVHFFYVIVGNMLVKYYEN